MINKIFQSIIKWFRKTFLGYEYIEVKHTSIRTWGVANRGQEDPHTKMRRKMEQKSRRINRLWAERKSNER